MMGLIDANNFKNAIKALESFEQKEDVLKLLEMMPIIDLKTMLEQSWIRCSERMPEDNKRVIVYQAMEPDISPCKYRVTWGWSVKASIQRGGITHWMPLPELPKESEE